MVAMFRRLLRWGFHIAAALSLVRCVATMVLWDRWYYVMDLWSTQGDVILGEPIVVVASGGGTLAVAAFTCDGRSFWPALSSGLSLMARGKCEWRWDTRGPGRARWWFNFVSQRDPQRFGAEIVNGVTIPYWALLIVAGVLPVCWCRPILVRRARRRSGRCLSCGYDLRASKERCPECGTAIPAPRVPTANTER
jgi:hypothetical protein